MPIRTEPALASAAGHDAAMPALAVAPPLLRLRGIGKRFGALQVLSEVSLDIAAGEIHCLLGENGAGKSTLCNLVFGIHAADAGTFELDGQPYRPQGPADALAQRVAMVHQHFSLVPDLTVVDNLLLGQARGLLDRRGCAERVAALSRRCRGATAWCSSPSRGSTRCRSVSGSAWRSSSA